MADPTELIDDRTHRRRSSAVRSRIGCSRLPPRDWNRGDRLHLAILATHEPPSALVGQPVVTVTKKDQVVH